MRDLGEGKGKKEQVPPPGWIPVHERLKKINKYAERIFSYPFTILETVLDNIQSFITQHSVSYSFCMCATITVSVSAAAIAVGVGTGVGVGCNNN
ncbi:unnamed protein product [Adineta ricciae]|uniref:Uncharacterized protein n=1 Tax=Adineta ricciae TaxID=249248 RepID=A0A814LRC9_ADIRI|nr:unnamed protein product [Adineta ricciae]CAF1069264.1 unnamed protein product [Adineta ricciae]